LSARSRNKGAAGERELIKEIYDLTGIELTRNFSQAAAGGHDLIGLDDWAIECKRYAVVEQSSKRMWWSQAVRQARQVSKKPVVCYRADRQPWRCIIPFPEHATLFDWEDFRCAADIDLELFCGIIREEIEKL
jgi:Holliday junction resolvase